MGVLKEEVVRFMQSTSLKGIPRIARSDSSVLRAVWMVGFSFFFTVCMYQSALLTTEYSRYHKVVILHEDTSENIDEYVFIRPQFSVCNLNPLTSNLSRYGDIPTFSQYTAHVHNVTHGVPDVTSRERDALQTLLGYYQYIGLQRASAVGHRQEEFIIDCSAIIVEGTARFRKPCEDVFNVQEQVSHEFFNCFTLIYRSDLDPTLLVTGVEMVLYLDNQSPERPETRLETLTSWPADGAVIAANPGDILPVMATTGVKLVPGMYTEVKLTATERTRLGDPYGNCRNQLPGYLLPPGLKPTTYYTGEMCTSLCISYEVAQRCGCLDALQSYTYGTADDRLFLNLNTNNASNGTHYCGNIAHDNGLLGYLNDTRCAHKVREDRLPGCSQLCTLPCLEKMYETEISSARWPPHPNHRRLYEELVARQLVASEDTNTNLTEFEVERFINANVLKVSMFLRTLTHVEIEDMAKTSLWTFISQLGGALNLWSGITMVLMVEVLDMLLRILWSLKWDTRIQQIEMEKEKNMQIQVPR